MASILVIDDVPFVRALLKKILEANGHSVMVSEGGLEALPMIDDRRNSFDLIMLDLEMPRINGLEVKRELEARHIAVPVILMSSILAGGHLARAAAMNNFSAHIRKPFTTREILTLIKPLLP